MVITFTVDSSAVQKRLQGAPAALRRHVAKKLRGKSAPAVKSKFRQFAPKNTGRLSQSGKTQVFPKSMRMTFKAGEGLRGPTGFPYPKWVAGEIPTINTRSQANPVFSPGQTIQYGVGGRSMAGYPIQWSSTPQWWNGVQKFARRKIPQDVNQAVKEFTDEMNK